MRVAIVNEGLGYPPHGGNWLRTLNLMLPLAARHEITYICRGTKDSLAVAKARAFYQDHGIETIITTGDHPSEKRGPAFYARLAANLISPLPYSVSAHRSRSVRREARQLLATRQIDIWQFEWLPYSDTITAAEARTIVMAHNVESLIWQRLFETEESPLRRWFFREQWKKYERFEGAALKQATRVVAVSAEDAALMRQRFGISDVSVVDNGVDTSYFAEVAAVRNPRAKQILFLGSLDWRPNVDSVDQLLDRIFPAVLEREPTATLCIVGRNPAPSLTRRAVHANGVEIHANVADVRPYLAKSAVLAVPLRIGGGSRLKILEAAAAGVPVVSTRIGAEGLKLVDGQDLWIAESVEDMADLLVTCLQRPDLAAACAKHALTTVRQYYDWQLLADRLESIWERTLSGSEPAARDR